jgi:hypothetical protein
MGKYYGVLEMGSPSLKMRLQNNIIGNYGMDLDALIFTIFRAMDDVVKIPYSEQG